MILKNTGERFLLQISLYKFVLKLIKNYTMAVRKKNPKKNNSGIAPENMVSEPIPEKQNGMAILTAITKKPENRMTSFEKMNAVKLGISKKDLENLKAKTRLDYDKLASALSVTRATLINKKKQEKFNTALSERIISLADIYSYGYEVFEDEERFNKWMFRPNQALGGKLPYEFIDNQFGREEIKNLIGRIDYGVYS